VGHTHGHIFACLIMHGANDTERATKPGFLCQSEDCSSAQTRRSSSVAALEKPDALSR
jgi:hypothetical protein